VLAGRTNVGKSSLINALVGYRRSIVFDAPGTTRDVVTATTALEGWPVELSDTAGLRASDDPLEAEGVRRARQQMIAADCLLLVFDGGRAWCAEDDALVESWPAAIVVHNKADLAPPAAEARPAGLRTSAITADGIDKLVAAIAARLVPDVPPPGAAVPFTPRQVDSLQRALDAAAGESLILAKHFLDICRPQPNTLGSAAGHEHVPGRPDVRR
jgi:tRNA modification GTPase